MAPKRWLFLSATAFAALADSGWHQAAAAWRAFRPADGLPEAACSTVTVGANGKVLVAHPVANSVSELDGYTIRLIRRPGPDLVSVNESPGGQIWSLAASGLNELKGDDWFHHEVPELSVGPPPIAVLPTQQGSVLLLLPDRLTEFNAKELNRPQTVLLRAADQTRLGSFSSLALARDGGLWVAGARGLAKAPGPLRGLRPEDPWREFVPPAELGIQNLREPLEDDQGGVTLVAESADGRKVGAYFYGEQWIVLPADSEKIFCAWRGPDRIFRALTAESLLRWDGGHFVESEEISARRFYDIAVEPGGAFWVATSDGLFRCAPAAWRIPEALERFGAHIRGVTGDAAGRLWFMANGSLHLQQNEVDREFPVPEAARNFSSCVLFPLKNDALLVAMGDALWQFSPGAEKFSAVSAAGAAGRLTPLGMLKDGGVCLQRIVPGAPTELLAYDGVRFQPMPAPPPDPAAGDSFSVSFAAQNGDLWLGGVVAACCHDGKWKAFVSADKTTPESAVGFVEMADGKIWCGTPDKIWEFDGRNWTVVRAGFDRLNGLIRAGDGSVWASSNNGLHRYWQGAWIEIGTEEGLPAAAVHEVCEDREGRIWAATAKGLSRYFPEADTDAPRTAIQKLADDTQALVEGASLSLLFSAGDKWKFTTRDRLLYSYRLDQNDWSAFQERNAVLFPELSAGKHSCQVRAMDRNGNVSTPAQLEFAVSLPWFRETKLLLIPFYGLAVTLLFAILAFTRHRQLLRNYAEVEKKVAQRTRELEQVNRELLHSQKMNALGTLAAGIAHDFNNILSIIKGSAQIIEENPGDAQKVRTRLDRIKTVVDQGSGIVKAMLGFSRDSGDEPGPCDLNGVVDDTVKLLGDRFLREVEVQFERAAGLPEIIASRDFIQQILLNFIFNASESMTGRKLVLLATQRFAKLPPGIVLLPAAAAAYAAISVRDSGCGIPPENLPRIFEPFFTTKALSARRGTGLGLSMAYELAKKLAAGLAVESVVGQGSVFTLILPVREEAAAVDVAGKGTI